MIRHPIETLRGLLDMGASQLALTHEEGARLVEEWDRMKAKAKRKAKR